jgi:rubrerythrin
MKIFVCRICGDVYIGEEIPHSCPFCGVENKFLVPPSVWDETYDLELTEIERKNVAKALEVEISNSSFYKLAFETLSNKEIGLMFKGLSKVEREHASVFRKILKSNEDPRVEVSCEDDPKKCIEESSRREKNASEFYKKAMSEAINPRLKEIFGAIMKTEQDHIKLDSEMLEKL